MKKIILLGANGSIGTQTLDVIKDKEFKVVGMSVGHDLELAKKNIAKFNPEIVCTRTFNDMLQLQKEFNMKIVYGDEGLIQVATYMPNEEILLVVALVGSIGLAPTVKAIEIGRNIALANKETLVMAGDIVMDLAKKHHVTIFPIDSEHSAIYQSLVGENKEDVKRLMITASGGSFRDLSREELLNVTLSDALKHPNWQMGAKITIDSSTMMNKGFEVIEAHHLFDIPYEKIDTILHPESIIHSMVEFKDSSIKAQMGVSDMRIPILYALTYPSRVVYDNNLSLINRNLTFKELSFERFPCLKMAYEAGMKGNIYPTVLNASNEAAVNLFQQGKISYLAIEKIIVEALANTKEVEELSLDIILKVNKEVQEEILIKYGGER